MTNFIVNAFSHLQEVGEKQKISLLGVVFFLYSLTVSATIQTYIVPELAPKFDLGDGLISLDSANFNEMAKDKAKEIKEKGWSAWELRPQTYAHVGIASIFYTLWADKPYSFLPFNALVHAISGCLVLWLLLKFFSWEAAIIGSALFLLNPAAMEWVAQIHRDGMFILGNLLVLVCMVQLWRGVTLAKIAICSCGFLCGMIGSCLVYFSRSYWVQVLLFTILLGIGFVGVFYWMRRDFQGRMKIHEYLFVVCSAGLVLFQIGLIKLNVPTNVPVVVELPPSKETISDFRDRVGIGQVGKKEEKLKFVWEQNQWIPERVQMKLFQMSYVRYMAIASGGKSLVDEKVFLNSPSEFLAYIPRALIVGILSPMPHLWFEEGSTPSMTLARKIMGGTTVVFYCLLIGGIAWIISFRRDPMMWIIIGFSLIGILVFTIAYPNVGTLLRFRYGFYMLLIAFGGAYILEHLLGRIKKNSVNESPG